MHENNEARVVKGNEKFTEIERVQLLQQILHSGNNIHGENWLQRIDFRDVDYLSNNTPVGSMVWDLKALTDELSKEATIADATYLALLYELIENDPKERYKRREQEVATIHLEPLPVSHIDIETVQLSAFTYLRSIGVTLLPQLPNVPEEVTKYVASITPEEAALLVQSELEGLQRSQGGMTARKPSDEFWHFLNKIQSPKTTA